MNRGEAKVGDRVLAPGWVFGNFGDTRHLEAVVIRDAGRVWTEALVAVEHEGVRRRVNVCWLEPAHEINQPQENQP